jgi:Cache 3/Cache 2 fusion domain
MKRRSLILSLLATGFFIAIATLIPDLAAAQADKVKAAMADLKARAEKLGAPTKADNSVVEAVAKDHGGVATIFVKAGNEYKRVATTVKKEDGSSAVGTPLDPKSAAIARLNNGEAYYGDATVFGKSYDAGYEPIKDASGAVIGAYFVGQPK